jgi:DNA polymerase-3 subunit gamma/tau
VSSDSHQPPSLYRRHRPLAFAEFVGQEPVVRTLRNAVERGRVHHAYLFVGSRGTGKTSMAKILASCLNCERGPTVEPCGECESCLSIARARSLDVIEMDAASNNSVEDIRALRESVAFAPVSGRTKVYILDEAHMLSQAAWNAFLKTLEEPPPETVFVLATTEAQKVPATVVDRCQRFDFQRPTVEQIAEVIRRAAEAESIEIAPEAVAALARAATGSFRDALGTLEQLLAYSGRAIELADVLAVLGVADGALLEEIFDASGVGDARKALLAVAAHAESGREVGGLTSDLEGRARELLLVQTLGGVPPELSLTPEADARLEDQAGRVSRASVVRMLELLAGAMEGVRAGADARTQLELALVKAARPELDPSTSALIARLERLEQGGTAPVPIPAATPSPALTTSPEPPPMAMPIDPPEAPREESLPESPPAMQEPPREESPEREPPREEPPKEDTPALAETWSAVVERVRGANGLIGAVIADARALALEEGELRVAFAEGNAFLKKKAEDPANREIVMEALREVTGRRVRLSYELHEELPGGPHESRPRSEEEWVARFVAEFDAEELTGEQVPLASEKGG